MSSVSQMKIRANRQTAFSATEKLEKMHVDKHGSLALKRGSGSSSCSDPRCRTGLNIYLAFIFVVLVALRLLPSPATKFVNVQF